MAITITTPTGNVGQRLTTRLLDAGADLILLVRHPEKLDDGVRQQAKVFQGELADTAFVVEATQAAGALFWVCPNNFSTPSFRTWYDSLAKSVAAAVQDNRISHVVNLSSVGAHLATGLGPISGLHHVEQQLNQVATNLIHLRPTYFMENYLYQLEALQTQSSVFLPFAGEQPMAMIATRDIADVVADLLLDRTWSGHAILGLHGPADVTFNEVAAVLSEVFGQSIAHVPVNLEQVHAELIRQGASPDVAAQYTEMWKHLSSPDYAPAEPRTAQTTTPTPFVEFAREVLLPLAQLPR